ncbi:MAG: citrate/2-methylcitrate synthase, partial [Verrucomicrobiota bacterium]
MSEDVLFTITKEHLETGLRGFPVGYCTTSHVDPQKGLFYLGRPVTELSTWQPEQVIYLLYHGKEGNKQELEKFSEMIKQRSCCSQQVIAAIEALPRQGHPMKLFCIALLLLGMHESADNYADDCLNIIAKVPHLAAAVINHHAGFGKTPNPRLDLGYMENFCYMLQVPDKKEELVSVMNLFNILHYDHGGGNLSTFVGKAVASGLEDMYGSICAAMCALEGPRHGRANQDCLEFVRDVLNELGEKATAKQV